jgi:RNA polymerase sigma-70 factor (ECF subfamily)
LYADAAAGFGAALERLARGYEINPDGRRDLLQEIHLALWRSLEGFDGRCSMRTWVYRVAHNVASTHVLRERRARVFVGLEEMDLPVAADAEREVGRHLALERLLTLIHQLPPLDRQVILSFLEGLDAAAISEVTGLSPGNVATKVHRIRNILARRFQQGDHHAH